MENTLEVDLGNTLSQTALGGFGSNCTVDLSFLQTVLLTRRMWNKLSLGFNSNSSTEWYLILNREIKEDLLAKRSMLISLTNLVKNVKCSENIVDKTSRLCS